MLQVGRDEADAALEREGRNGFRIDDRFQFAVSKRPLRTKALVTPQFATDPWVFDPAASTARPLSRSEQSERAKARDALTKSDLEREIRGSYLARPAVSPTDASRVAIVRPDRPDDPSSTTGRLMITTVGADAAEVCQADECGGMIVNTWWSPDGKHVVFERYSDNLVTEGFYSWTVGHDRVRRLDTPDGFLEGCVISPHDGGKLICAAESISRPAHIVAIDLDDGGVYTVVDVNPEFQSIRLTAIEKMEWSSRVGDAHPDQTFGYIVEPRDYQPGKRYPLVVLTKQAVGFLQEFGGGGEYPAHLFADAGLMVFVCHEPFATLLSHGIAGRYRKDFPVRRHTLASLEAGLDLLERRGLIDPARIALTGFSDGAELAFFALYRSSRKFATLIVSSPTWEPSSYFLIPRHVRGIAKEAGLRLEGGEPSPWFYKGLSPSRNVSKLNLPILFHISDAEIFSALPSMVALDEAGKPYEGYVFPDEWHLKWQPAHLRAIWIRNTQWLEFWLLGRESAEPLDPDQYPRWRSLRRMAESLGAP